LVEESPSSQKRRINKNAYFIINFKTTSFGGGNV